MKSIRKLAIIIGSVLLSVPSFQILGFGASYAKEPDSKMQYALDVLCNTYLDFQELGTNKALISDPFTVTNYHTNQDDYDIFFVLSPDAVLGILTVGITDTGEYTSSFSAGNWKILNQAYQNKTPIALYADNKKLYLYNAEDNTVCELNNTEATPEDAPQTLNTELLHIVEISQTSYNICLGDFNFDGTVGVIDAQLVLKHYTAELSEQESSLTAAQKKVADVNGDTKVSVEDAQMILNYYVQNMLVVV